MKPRKMKPIQIAHHLVSSAIRNGILVRQNRCEHCAAEIYTVAHHEDYNKPLGVVWLCRKCHGKAHVGKPVVGGMKIKLDESNEKSLIEFREQSSKAMPVGSLTEIANHFIRVGLISPFETLKRFKKAHQAKRIRVAHAISKHFKNEKPYTFEQLRKAGTSSIDKQFKTVRQVASEVRSRNSPEK